jgi:hypothetical protein
MKTSKNTMTTKCVRIWIVLGLLIAYGVQASDRYVTLAYTNDTIRLSANETAIILSALPIAPALENWQIIEYQKGTNDAVTVTLSMEGPWTPLPLSGPGVVRFGSQTQAGVVGVKIVKGVSSKDYPLAHYVTFANPGDHLQLAANETAMIVATGMISLDYSAYTSIRYIRESNGPVDISVPVSDPFTGQLPLQGPASVTFTPDMNPSSAGPGIVSFIVFKTPTRSR